MRRERGREEGLYPAGEEGAGRVEGGRRGSIRPVRTERGSWEGRGREEGLYPAGEDSAGGRVARERESERERE